MEQRVSLITLGVSDLARAREFYEALGWRPHPIEATDVVFFQAGGIVVGLWGRAQLAADVGIADDGCSSGVVLAHNVGSPGEVDAVIAEAQAAGATVGKQPEATFWGGYSGVFIDPDGHAWEIAHNPFWTINDDGSITL